MTPGRVAILGAGLCGSLLATMLARRGLDVLLCERGHDPRTEGSAGGRSINLALAARGMRALREAGALDAVRELLVPMRGRLVHERDGSVEMLPYGQRPEERIYSVSRAALNELLVAMADREHGVTLRFRQESRGLDEDGTGIRLHDHQTDRNYSLAEVPVIAADGAGSATRRSLQESGRVTVSEDLLEHGYKELVLPPGRDGDFLLDPEALHIWPRGGFMLIALPNPGGDFTLTLFLPREGPASFSALDTPEAIEQFFAEQFSDVAGLIPDLASNFAHNPVGVLGTVRCRPWHVDGRILLVGDAAHAIVPFHGQGMNLAFEDCRLISGLLDRGARDWGELFRDFERAQCANADAIADMALDNYVEMRDTVRDPTFSLQKALAFELERRLPDRFIPRYSMVMFHDEIPYAVAQQRGRVQQALLAEFTRGKASLAEIDVDRAEVRAREALPPISP